MSNVPAVSILHRIPGRVRLGVEALRRSPGRAERLVERARAAPGVRDARANPGAACLVIEYDASLPLDELLGCLGRIPELSACASLDPEAPPRNDARRSPAWTAEMVLRTAHKVNAASALPVPHLDLKILVPGALAGYGVFRFLTARGAGTPHWLVFFMYGFDVFVSLNRGAINRWLGEAAPAAGSPAADGARP
jgi:hypothetical protein